jgi:AcrR family transcriptional regulator
MARPAIHTEDALLDSARAIVVDRGARAATVAAVREASGASIGSIYHRCGSVDEILARAWIRAARRSQDAALGALTDESCESVVAAALAMFDFCVASPDDAVLLTAFRRSDFLDSELPAPTRQELEHANDPIAGRIRSLSHAVFGRADRPSVDLLLIALVDLPSAFAHRRVAAMTTRRGPYRRHLEATVRALVCQP